MRNLKIHWDKNLKTMTTKLKATFIATFLFLISIAVNAQARLTIENNSMRQMTVKVMKGSSGKGALHESVTISAYGSETIYFTETGYYFTKSKAILNGKDPVYKKGKSFKVINGTDGYSVLRLTFTIKESAVAASTGQTISKSEFDQN